MSGTRELCLQLKRLYGDSPGVEVLHLSRPRTPGGMGFHALCGKRSADLTTSIAQVTCIDCLQRLCRRGVEAERRLRALAETKQ